MGPSNLERRYFVLAAVLLAITLAGRQSQAITVGAHSFGNDLAGAEINILFAQSGLQTAMIAEGLPDQGVASVSSFFDFSVTGHTWFNTWHLTNTTDFDTILSVEIDLSNTTSPGFRGSGPHSPGILFDITRPGLRRGTWRSNGGREGAHRVSGPRILSSVESIPWAEPNEGDLFIREEINYRDFGPGLTSVWRDDTDIVGVHPLPEPSSAFLLIFAGCALLRRNGLLRKRPVEVDPKNWTADKV